MLHKIAALGVTLAVDDFGTGYTSMSQLEQMPLSTLKIDRSFTRRLADDPAGATLVKAMVDLAHEFGLEVVAEGVEDSEVTDKLRELGCDIGQGFLWSRPVTSAALPEVLVSALVSSPSRDGQQLGRAGRTSPLPPLTRPARPRPLDLPGSAECDARGR